MKTDTIEPTTATNDLRQSFTVFSKGGKEKTVIKIRLNDKCLNGHEDFAMTADIYEDGKDVGGGCCHKHILALRPDLAPFAALHLSDWKGAPMHAASNAWYWFQGAFPDSADHSPNLGACHGGTGSSAKTPDECKRIFMEHIRADESQVKHIVTAAPRSEQELQAVMEDMGFPAQWEREAKRAILQMEEWAGKTFQSQATRSQFTPLSQEVRTLINERRASGYYEPAQVQARDIAAKAEKKAKRIASIHADHSKSITKLESKLAVELALAEFFPDNANVIYYDHTKEVSFNWSTCDRLHTKAEFDAFTQSEHAQKLVPLGLKIVWNEKPRH
jgi:hypothetical protein